MVAVRDEIIELLMPLKDKIKTLTSDNGLEFAEHENISKALNCGYYFVHPYASWEQGTNKNANGLIRQYFPKKMPFDSITEEDVLAVAHRLNKQPRKRLGFKTPYEVFY